MAKEDCPYTPDQLRDKKVAEWFYQNGKAVPRNNPGFPGPDRREGGTLKFEPFFHIEWQDGTVIGHMAPVDAECKIRATDDTLETFTVG